MRKLTWEGYFCTIGGPSKIPYDMEEIWKRTNWELEDNFVRLFSMEFHY